MLAQAVAPGWAVKLGVGKAFTVTTADPLFPVPALLLASVTETNVYVVFAVGLIEIFAPEV